MYFACINWRQDGHAIRKYIGKKCYLEILENKRELPPQQLESLPVVLAANEKQIMQRFHVNIADTQHAINSTLEGS